MLSQIVSLHDVKDAEGFVRATIAKGRLRLTVEERDELTQEGLRIMCKLANDYEPGRNGLDASSSKFSGYAAKFLPGKLSDAWHRLQGHHQSTRPDGVREWQYEHRATSLTELEERPGGLDTVKALAYVDGWEMSVLDGLVAILHDWWARKQGEVPAYFTMELMTEYFEKRGEGYSTAEFGFQARLLPIQAKAVERFGRELLDVLRRDDVKSAAA